MALIDETANLADRLAPRPAVGKDRVIQAFESAAESVHAHDLARHLADVHAALAYYLDHRAEIERQIAEGERLADQLAAEQGATRFTRLLHATEHFRVGERPTRDDTNDRQGMAQE